MGSAFLTACSGLTSMACLEQVASHSESDKKLLALPPQPPHGNWMQAPVLGEVNLITVQYFLGGVRHQPGGGSNHDPPGEKVEAGQPPSTRPWVRP